MAEWLEEGTKAPDFTLPADDGTRVKLSSLRGQPVVLYFYPKDDTPGCTKEACSFRDRKKELANRPLIREQAFGESLDPDKLERLARYEVHLDRRLERTLSMLFRLKELRPATVESWIRLGKQESL